MSLLLPPVGDASARFTFGSPATSHRHMPINVQPDVTDTSAATTPTNRTAPYPPTYADAHPLSALSASALGLSSRGNSPEPSGDASPSYAPIRRSKDKQKHSESENRRRQRLRAKFTALQIAAGVGGKKDRYSILGQAVEKLKEYEQRILRVEQEKAALAAQLAQTTLASGVGSPSNTTPGTPPLSTPLSHFQMLANVAVCYISLDGRILDANGAFVGLFAFTGANAQAAAGATTLVPENTDMTTSGGGGCVAHASPDIYTSSIFALTHHQELIHTLSILRNLLCGVMASYECTKRCLDMRGQTLECAMTITSVIHAGKIVMFLCAFVPKGNGGGTTATMTAGPSINGGQGPAPMTDTASQQQQQPQANPQQQPQQQQLQQQQQYHSSASSGASGNHAQHQQHQQPPHSQLSSSHPSSNGMFPPPMHGSPSSHRAGPPASASSSVPNVPMVFSPNQAQHRVYSRPPVYGGPSGSTSHHQPHPHHHQQHPPSAHHPPASSSSAMMDDTTVSSTLAPSPHSEPSTGASAPAAVAATADCRSDGPGRTSPISSHAPPRLQSAHVPLHSHNHTNTTHHIGDSGVHPAAHSASESDVAVANSFLDLASPAGGSCMSQPALVSSSSGTLSVGFPSSHHPSASSVMETPLSASRHLFPTLDRPLSDLSDTGASVTMTHSALGGGSSASGVHGGAPDLNRVTSNHSMSGFALSPTGSTSQFLTETPPA